MTESERPPRSPERAEGDPAGEEPDAGRTPHPDEPAEGGDRGDGPADSPGT
ncbi:hypothetical protein JOD57_002131 [Geodermatophilus bullaregiensis]|uniref:hypothetical protein n=1 Tax=Geodermatophilus bullaregiensis TaxID=1564160 RepID=UPI00195CED78|nr:hypothetical protein [Geodermatophilus bullaregiensis]MBM7806294.1 hypothetical protein [Geodermatophilus bullaregiensis]